MEIQNNIIKEKFGFDFKDTNIIKNSTATRDNEMFSIQKKLIKEGYSGISIDKDLDEKYKISFYKDDVIIEEKLVKWGSIGTKLKDIAWLDPSLEVFFKYGTKSSRFKEYVLNYGKINVDISKENYLLLKAGGLSKSKIVNYWKNAGMKNYKEDIFGKLYLSIYMNIKNIYPYSNSVVDEKIKTVRIKELQDFINPMTQEDFIKDTPSLVTVNSNLKDEKKMAFTRTIENITNDVREGHVEIPVFQRDYIWKPKHVVSLLNSLVDDIPIGSILMAETKVTFGNKNKIISSLLNNDLKDIRNLIIDGQQRLTSILAVLFSSSILNILGRSAAAHDERRIIGDISNKIFLWENKFWLKKDLIDNGNKQQVKNENTIKYTYEDAFLLLKDKEVSIIKIKGYDIEKLINVFEKINIGSTKLTNIDLMHASFFSHDEKYDFLKELSTIMNSPKIKEFNLPKDKIVNMWKILFDIKFNNPKIKVSNKELLAITFDKEESIKWMNMTSEIIKYIENVIYELETVFGFNNILAIPNDAFLLVPLFVTAKNIDSEELYKRIIYGTIDKSYSSGTTSKVVHDINSYLDRNDIVTVGENSIKENYDKLRYSNNRIGFYKLIIGHLSLKNPISLINGVDKVVSNNMRWKKADKDQHHFIPKKNKYFNNIKIDQKNRIGNIFIISSKENREDIKANSPIDYLLSSKNIISKSDIFKVEKSHFINEGCFNQIKSMRKEDNIDNNKIIQTILDDREANIYKSFIEKWFGK